MKRILIRTIPALLIGIALIVSALIFEKGCRRIASGLYNISHSVEESTQSVRQNINDFPSTIRVILSGGIDVTGSIETWSLTDSLRKR